MLGFLSFILTVCAALLVISSVVFCAEIVASLFASPDVVIAGERKRVAVLVPAHNESKGLLPTIKDVKQQLKPGDRLVVVADNCSDDTAQVAAGAGAEVTKRNDPTRVGKGYALDWGLRFFDRNPPDIVIIVDADCRLSPGSIDQLAMRAAQSNRPIQALYLMAPPETAAVNLRVATFAWRVKNWARPLGLKALDLPCQLMGTGMAFPWQLIRSAELSSGAIVEDLQLGLDLAAEGHAPMFCASAVVSSTFPQTAAGAKAQRQRWEHGHIGLILTRALPLIFRGLTTARGAAVALALDLFVPPLSLLIALLTVIAFASWLLMLANGSRLALLISVNGLGLVGLATVLAWLKYARDILPLRAIGLIPLYVLAKLRLYSGTLLGRKVSRWVRADRA
jgi:cellulose synthase/poly-beta-1,6-N-acetylglucosamine synthase-like glycosyltransferase